MKTTFVVGADLQPAATNRTQVDLGLDHPGRSGIVEIDTHVSDDTVTAATVRPGAIHRGVEKLFEVRDYRQVLSLANRHDWQASFSGELGAALTIETALGLIPPPRATALRTVLAEHARLHSHLGFLSAIPATLVPDVGLLNGIRTARAKLRQQLEALTGNRIHPMVCRLGGMATDADDTWLAAEVALAHETASLGQDLQDAVAMLPRGVAVLAADQVAEYGLSGPAARAAGRDLDLRRDPGYLDYGSLPIDPVTETRADAVARLTVMAREVATTCSLLADAVTRTATIASEISVYLPKVIRVPETEVYLATEAPLGRAGWWLVSRGEKTPWRLKLRTASFANLAALEAALPGTAVTDVPLAVASLGYVVGDVAK